MGRNTLKPLKHGSHSKQTAGPVLRTRDVLLSTGEFTIEAVITDGGIEYHDSAPMGETLGLKETQSLRVNNKKILTKLNTKKNILKLSQSDFDKLITQSCDSQTSTAFSLAYLQLLSSRAGHTKGELYKHLTIGTKNKRSSPQVICNVLNGGKHAFNGLAFCEFMIIPIGDDASQNLRIASEVYSDLGTLIKGRLGANHLMIGREGGFSPLISSTEDALSLLEASINKRNKNKCFIAIDVAANNFTKKSGKTVFKYIVNEQVFDTNSLTNYYLRLLAKYPSINYLEDPFHENDILGWKKLFTKVGKKIMIVADDLTVSQLKHVKKYKNCFNACILKINQAGNFTELAKTFQYCEKNGIKTILSQRSGETDSNTITHIAVGMGSNYLKAGAPARERIVKYNELLRITTK